MPTNTPPKYTATWATDGGADKAAPAGAKHILGFEGGDLADFNSNLNFVLNRIVGFSDFLWRTTAPDTAAHNLELGTETNPFTSSGSLNGCRVRYDSLADRWFAISCDASTSGNVLAFDSEDGVTWSTAKQLSTTETSQEEFGPIYSNGTLCAAAVTAAGKSPSFWLSTDNTVANLVETATTIGSLDIVKDFLYDQDSSRWFVLGTNDPATTGYIYSSADGTAWTLETTSASNFCSFATDHAGNAIAIHSDSGTPRYATSGGGGMAGTWSVGGAGMSASGGNIQYLPNVGLWAAVDSANRLWLYDSPSGTPFNTDYDVDVCLWSQDVNLFIGDPGTRSLDREIYSIVNAQAKNIFNIRTLGFVAWDEVDDWDNNFTFEGGQGKLPFSYAFGGGTTERHGNFVYGPSKA